MTAGYQVLHFYQQPALSEGRLREKLNQLRAVCPRVIAVDSEFCYNVECNGKQPCRNIYTVAARMFMTTCLLHACYAPVRILAQRCSHDDKTGTLRSAI